MELLADRQSEIALTVNVTLESLTNPDFVGFVSSLVRSNANVGRLYLELTESVPVPIGPLLYKHIERLKDLGVRFMIDDFGCGFASLRLFRQIRVDYIKFGRNVLTEIEGSRGADRERSVRGDRVMKP